MGIALGAPQPLGRRALVVAVAAAGGALAALVFALSLDPARLPSGGRAVPLLVVALGVGFVSVGTFASLRGPESPMGLLLSAFGLSGMASVLFISDAPALYVLAALSDAVTLAIFVHVVLAFPTGELEGRAARVTVTAGYAFTLTLPLAAVLVGGGADDYGCAGCPSNPLAIAHEDKLADALLSIAATAGLAIALVTLALMVGRWRRAKRLQRRALAPVLLAGTAILALAVVWIAVQAADVGETGEKIAQIVFISGFALLPAAFLVGLLRAHFFRTTAVSLLLDRLARAPGASGLEEALAAALGDPSLTVAYWVPEHAGYVDAGGRPLELASDGDGRVTTEITRGDARVGALVHHAALLDEPELLRATAAAAGLALENGRLEAELRARVAALRASRARIVEAGDEERRRLGRDLHDGAQQRLVSILLQLQLATERWGERPERDRNLVERALDDARAAVDELRELAAGIHPAVLAQRGLDAGLESLATRSTVPVELASPLGERLPAPVESAAYFVVAEALTNVAKYAGATHATVAARRDDGQLVVDVRDDGVGGASVGGGSGLRGLEDRVGALGGSLEVESPAGGGTLVRARIPLAA